MFKEFFEKKKLVNRIKKFLEKEHIKNKEDRISSAVSDCMSVNVDYQKTEIFSETGKAWQERNGAKIAPQYMEQKPEINKTIKSEDIDKRLLGTNKKFFTIGKLKKTEESLDEESYSDDEDYESDGDDYSDKEDTASVNEAYCLNHEIYKKNTAKSNSNAVDKFLQIPSFIHTKSDIEKYIDDSFETVTFAQKLNQYIYEKDLTTAMIYRRCLVDRKLISKITTQETYHPSKNTVLALCIGLQLTLPQGEEFLSLAGYGFNRSSKFDLIIKFMLENKIYDLETINEMLLYFKQPCFE